MTREDIEKKMHEAAEEIKPLITTLVEALCEAHQKGYLAGVELGAKMAYPYWIPVEERLPEVGEKIIFYSPRIDDWLSGALQQDGRWWCEEYGTYFYDVTHWMSLPQPPRKEE